MQRSVERKKKVYSLAQIGAALMERFEGAFHMTYRGGGIGMGTAVAGGLVAGMIGAELVDSGVAGAVIGDIGAGAMDLGGDVISAVDSIF